MSKNKRNSSVTRLTSSSKRQSQSMYEEFEMTSSQHHNVRLKTDKEESPFSLPKSFQGRPVDFLRLMITPDFIKELIPAPQLKLFKSASTFKFF